MQRAVANAVLVARRSPLVRTAILDSNMRHILIVDDLADNRDILARRLRARGYKVTEVSGGFEALRLIEDPSIALVLLDVAMPGLSGMQTLQQIRVRRTARELPVIMVTADAQKESITMAQSLGANDHITRPIDFAAALKSIQLHLALTAASARIDHARRDLQRTQQEAEQRGLGRKADALVVWSRNEVTRFDSEG